MFRKMPRQGLPVGAKIELHPRAQHQVPKIWRQPHRVFFGCDQKICAMSVAQGEQCQQVVGTVGVVVGEGRLRRQMQLCVGQGSEKRFRAGDAGKGQELSPPQRVQRDLGAGESPVEMAEAMPAAKDRLTGKAPLNKIEGSSSFCGIIGSGENDHIRPLQMIDRFPQRAYGDEPAVAEGIDAVEQDDVQIAMQGQVLEAVIEHEQLGAPLRDGGKP